MTDPDSTDPGTGAVDALDDLDARLLDDYQRGIPVTERPFDAIADRLGRSATAVLDRLRRHEEGGLVRRVGPVLDPSVIGASTLAALRVPDDEVADVADVVSGYTEVSHNYRRDHDWNVWFVVTAQSRQRLDAVLDGIANRTGHDPLVLPKRETFCLDFQFPVVGDRTDERGRPTDGAGRDASRGETGPDPDHGETGPDPDHGGQDDGDADLRPLDAAILGEIQDGLSLTRRPYAAVADAVGTDTGTVVDAVRRLLATGHVKRVGVVVDHHAAGFRHNAMVVWDVPDDALGAAGTAAGAHPLVTKCYHRPRRPDRDWPYNLFTMVHGRDPDAVEACVTDLAADRVPHPHERLETLERFKQTGTRYDDLLSGHEG